MPDVTPFSYSGDPASSLRDAIRFEIQDTDPQAPLLTDPEVQFCINQEATGDPPSQGEMLAAAARGLEALSRRFAAQADTKVGSLETTYSKMAKGFAERAAELRRKAAGMGAPFWGGRSESEKNARAENPDRVQPAFTRDQFTTPWRGTPGGGPGPVREGTSL
jgi:hypothetical protein